MRTFAGGLEAMEILKHQFTAGTHSIWLTSGDGCAKGEGRTFAEAYWNALDVLSEHNSAITVPPGGVAI